MVKGMTIGLLACAMAVCGCDDLSTMFAQKEKKVLPDPQAPIRIVGQFFKDNAPQATSAEVWLVAPQRQQLSLPLDVQLQVVSAMQSDCRPLKSGQDIENIRGTMSQPLATVVLNGSNYAMVVYLDTFGLSMGNQGTHRFINPQLASLLRRLLEGQNLMRGNYGQVADLALKKAAGQVSLYQQVPPPMDVN